MNLRELEKQVKGVIPTPPASVSVFCSEIVAPRDVPLPDCSTRRRSAPVRCSEDPPLLHLQLVCRVGFSETSAIVLSLKIDQMLLPSKQSQPDDTKRDSRSFWGEVFWAHH